MGATLSYLGYASNQHPHTPSHGHVSQQQYQYYRPFLILSHRDTTSPSIIDLYTRLIILEKDLQTSQVGNTHKEIVIQYLLQSNASNSCFQENLQLKAQLLVLKTTIDRTNRENEEIKDKMRKAEEAIALFLSNVPVSGPLPISTTLSSYTSSPVKGEAVTEDLIDLLGCIQESDNGKPKEENASLRDELHEDEPDIKEVSRENALDRVLHQSSDPESEGPSYLVHFADRDEDDKTQDTVVLSAKLGGSCGLSNSITTSRQQDDDLGLSEKSDDSSLDDASSPCDSASTATSFNTTSCGISPSDDVHLKLFNEGVSQPKILEREGGNLDKSMAVVSTLADNLPSCGTRQQAKPSGSTIQTPTKAQGPQTDNTTEPRWSCDKIFDSARDRENAVWINKRSTQTGANNVPQPDFFKYGIHYVPRVYEQDTYRTIVISGLSPSVTMKALLEKVRGGTVVDAKLLDTAKIIGSNTALVTFLYELSAMAYEDYARLHPITFSNAPARIAVVSSPTWPMPFSLRTAIEKLGHTRCFEVHNFPPNISLPAVRQELTFSPVMKSNSLECMTLGADGVLELRFSSIRAAAQSFALFRKTFRYRDCTVKCIPDPCAQPLETLLKQPTNISTPMEEDTSDPSCNSDVKTSADEGFGRLAKVDWNIEAECRRGRGFDDDKTNTTADAHYDLAGQNTSPSPVSTEEPLRQENAASIASFAKSFFPSG